MRNTNIQTLKKQTKNILDGLEAIKYSKNKSYRVSKWWLGIDWGVAVVVGFAFWYLVAKWVFPYI